MEKEKFELEYMVKSSVKILYNRLATPSGLSDWFADNVNIKDDIYSFYWNESEEQAKMLEKKPGEFIRYQWLDEEDEAAFFEFRIKIDPITNEVALLVTDFAEPDEKDEAMHLWDTQINILLHILGS